MPAAGTETAVAGWAMAAAATATVAAQDRQSGRRSLRRLSCWARCAARLRTSWYTIAACRTGSTPTRPRTRH
eukprot:scaffold73283_cov76-Phaeocystis_antarctica.AAC.1